MRFHISIPVPYIGCKTTLLGNLEVDAVLNKRGEIDYNRIDWNGCDLYLLLENMTEAEDVMQMITGACMDYVNSLEPFERFQLEKYGNIVESQMLVYESRRNAFHDWSEKQAEVELLKHE